MQSSDDTPLVETHALAKASLRKINAFAISLLQQRTLDELLSSMVESVGNLLGYEDCVIYLREGNLLVQGASFPHETAQRSVDGPASTLRVGEGIVGGVAKSGLARIVSDTRTEPDYVKDEFGGLSELAVPILFEDRVLGVLDTESRQAQAYGEADRALLQSIANIAASRIASAQAERERRALVAKLEAKNAELQTFNYTVSHDLKSPLITIQGFLGLLEKDALAGNRERMERDIERIRAAVSNMGSLLNDLLKLSRAGSQLGPPVDVDLGEVARDAVAQVAGSIHKRGVKVEVADGLPWVSGDRQRLMEVLQNLVDNSVKFMGDQADPRIEIGYQDKTDAVVVFVQDNGQGIDPKFHEKIFGLFDRLATDVEGTGIGLALVKRIIDLHHGRVWVESEGPGSGSTFFFSLPPAGSS